jgi:hypothetical protein
MLLRNLRRFMLPRRQHHPTVDVTLDKELLQLPANGAEAQWIADIEQHLRGDNRLRPPFAYVPKQLGPLG